MSGLATENVGVNKGIIQCLQHFLDS